MNRNIKVENQFVVENTVSVSVTLTKYNPI